MARRRNRGKHYLRMMKETLKALEYKTAFSDEVTERSEGMSLQARLQGLRVTGSGITTSDDFQQPIKQLQQHLSRLDIAIAQTTIQSTLTLKGDGIEKGLKLLKELLSVIRDNLDSLAEEGVKVFQRNAIARGKERFPKYEYIYRLGKGPRQKTGPSDTLQKEFDKILQHLSKRYVIRNGTVGYGHVPTLNTFKLEIIPPKLKPSRYINGGRKRGGIAHLVSEQLRDIDSYQRNPLHGISNTPYKIAWQIIEFGTGMYAHPRIRGPSPKRDKKLQVPSEAPGAGAWYWIPNVLVYGQEGLHFLLETAKNRAEFMRDRAEAEKAISDKLRQLYLNR